MFIFNPIYQSDDGSVYAVPGNSASMGGDYMTIMTNRWILFTPVVMAYV